jgi:hypothetical protein
VAVELSGSRTQEIDQINRRMKRIGDNGSVCERQRCEKLSVDFGEQDGVRWQRRAVECSEPFEPFVIGGGAET